MMNSNLVEGEVMKSSFLNSDLLNYWKILTKTKKISDAVVQWEIAGRRLDIERLKAPLDEALTQSDRVKEFNRKYRQFLERNGTPESGVKFADGSIMLNYKLDDALKEELNKLRDNFKNDLDEEEVRAATQEDLLKKEVTAEFEPIKFEWISDIIGDVIDGDDLSFLRRHKLVTAPKKDSGNK